jgi:hypothetical protein
MIVGRILITVVVGMAFRYASSVPRTGVPGQYGLVAE